MPRLKDNAPTPALAVVRYACNERGWMCDTKTPKHYVLTSTRRPQTFHVPLALLPSQVEAFRKLVQ